MSEQTTLPLAGEDDTLSQINALGKQLDSVEANIKHTEELLSSLKATKKDIQERQLPDLMLSCGMKEFKLIDGGKISMDKFYDAKLVNREACFAFLRKTGNDGIIKNTIKCDFGKGEEKAAATLETTLEEQGYIYQRKADIHHQTLKSFVKDCMENGLELPKEDFGVYEGNRVTIKR